MIQQTQFGLWRTIIVLYVMTVWPVSASAQLTRGGGPLEISADQGRLDEREKTIVYQGNVEITQGKARLVADEVTILYGASDETQDEATLFSGIEGVVEIQGHGGVAYRNGPDQIRAEHWHYLAARDQLTLSGNVWLQSENGTAQSETMIIDLKAGQSVLTPKPGGRVRIVLDIEALESKNRDGEAN